METRRNPRRILRRVLLSVFGVTAAVALTSEAWAAKPRDVPLPKPKPSVARDSTAPVPRPKPQVPQDAAEPARKPGDRDQRISALPPHVTADEMPPKAPPVLRSDVCLEALKAEGVEAVRAEAPKDKPWCIIDDPVAVVSVTGPGGKVDFPAKPLLSCTFARAFASWINGVVAPVGAQTMESEIKSIDTGPGYVCRNMNGATQGKRSAHAIGNAMDVVGFRFHSGKNVLVESFDAAKGDERLFLSALRTSACGYFLTVLGPGSDAAHGNHLHVDIAQHGRSANYRICQ